MMSLEKYREKFATSNTLPCIFDLFTHCKPYS